MSEAEFEPIQQVVILAIPESESPTTLRAIEPDSGMAMDTTTLADYSTKTSRGSYEARFRGIGPYRLLPLAELNAFDGGWEGFYQRHPGAAGLFTFSRVGVSKDGQEAIVRVMHLRGGLWGHIDSMLFRRRGDTWHLAGEQRLEDI
ncbi:MAG TPA: hypothetical protein VFY27_07000 [Woeseiaceae bacterium]|nr:hypothetical protein [Woeseiaceae bacterium]